MLPLRIRVNPGAMAMKGYFAFPDPKALLKTRNQIVLCYIQDTRWESLNPLLRCNRRILQPQPTTQFICKRIVCN